MKANELRLGNIIEFNKEPFNVCVIYDNAIENELWCKPINELHPIPLTEEWLVKFGFDVKTKTFTRNLISIKQQTKGCFFYHTGIMIQYVHQLQNLYFAVTGEELTIG